MRKRATKALLACGIPMNQSGFLYILDAMEIYEKNGAPMTNMKIVYGIIAKHHNVQPEYVCENIRYSIDFGFANCGSGAFVNYFGFTDKSNGNYLAMMWKRLKEEE